VANAVVAYATYLRQMVLPTGLSPLYPLRALDPLREVLPATLVLLGLSAIACVHWRRRPWLAAGLAWFFVTLLPVIGLVQVGMQAHADRYMYLPSVGLLLALCSWLHGLGSLRDRWRPVAVPVLVFYAALAWIQTGYWNGPVMFFSRILDVAPHAWQAHVGLANTYLRAGDLRGAEAHVAEAQRLAPAAPAVIGIAGNVWMERGDPARAALAFRAVLEQEPASALAMHNLALALAAQGRRDEAATYFDRAREIQPERFGGSGR
jgi:tetratricopeptide (TPR) repeat protein